MMKRIVYTSILAGLIGSACVLGQSDLMQVHEDFSKDPGWEWKHNRIVAADPPTIDQNFGWAPSNQTGAGPGEIGGRMWQSTTPAYYALPLNRPLSFKDKFSFSCRIAFPSTGGGGAAYLGFFNHQLQGWRVWNSMAVRLGGESGGQAAIGADSMTALWEGAGGSEGYSHVATDGKPHTLRFSYDPDAVQGPWTDVRLRTYMSTKRQSTEEILEKALKEEPGLTKEQLWKRLEAAHAEGLVYYLQRTGRENIIGTTSWNGYFWGLRDEKERPDRKKGREKGAGQGKKEATSGPSEARSLREGAMIVQVDDGPAVKIFIFRQAKEDSVSMDRFGLFNLQMYHQHIDLYMSDLTVNGHKVDLSKEPGWEGNGNRVRFVEQDFQREDYGHSETNWAGEQIGEVGGKFTSAEPVDPIYGYYADDIGKLTLDDPISFSGTLCFAQDSTDAGMYIGFFSKSDLMADLSQRPQKHKTAMNSMGILVEGGAHGGKQFMPQLTSSKDTFVSKSGLEVRPTKERHAFKIQYDPAANNNIGRITASLDDKTIVLDLTAEMRADGGVFDRFGVTNLRAGGKYVEMYFDDLTYTARRPSGYKPVFHKQEVVKVPYPPGGRKY